MHLDVLAADPYRGDPARGGPGVVAQRLVIDGSSAEPPLPDIAAALRRVRNDWAEPDGPAGGSYVIAVGDNASYPGDLRVHIPAATRLILVAASIGDLAQASGRGTFPAGGAYSAGLRPVVRGSLTVSGEGGSSLIVDGLVIDGDVVVRDGELGSIALSQCTVSGGVRVGRPGRGREPGAGRAAGARHRRPGALRPRRRDPGAAGRHRRRRGRLGCSPVPPFPIF